MSSLILAPAAPLVAPAKRQRRPPIAIVVPAILFLPPTVILSIGALYLEARGLVADRLIHSAWERTLSSGEPAAPWAGTARHPVARVAARSAGLDAIVLSGAPDDVSDIAPTWLSPTGTPDPREGVVIADGDGAWRHRLGRIGVGDIVTLEWLDTHRRCLRARQYRVDAAAARDGRGWGPWPTPSGSALTLIASQTPDALPDVSDYVVYASAMDD